MAERQFLANAHHGANGGARLFSLDELHEAQGVLRSIPGYRPTPLRNFASIATRVGARNVYYKDETGRFANGSFKALGAAVAIEKALDEHGNELVVAAATAGNYGRALAWAAANRGLRCVIYVHSNVSKAAVDAIAAYGAEIRSVAGDYDRAVDTAAREAAREGWLVVSDTTSDPLDPLPRWVMIGYAAMMAEVDHQADEPLNIVLLQGGVGGLAAAVAGWFETLGKIPQLYIFEPIEAACLLESARQGRMAGAQGNLHTEMVPLACRQPSALAWPVLARTAAGFFTIKDCDANAGLQELERLGLDAGICSGAAVGALDVLALHVDLRDKTVLLIGTEGSKTTIQSFAG